MAQQTEIWKIFIPCDILQSQGGQLCGKLNEKLKLVYISGVCGNDNVANDNIIGVWIPRPSNKKCSEFLCMNKSSTGQIECKIQGRNRISCTCVVYDPDVLMKSYFIACRENLSGGDGFVPPRKSVLQTLFNYIHESEQNKATNKRKYLMLPVTILTKLLVCVFGSFRMLLDNRYINPDSVIRQVLDTPSIIYQLSKRCKQNRYLSKSEEVPSSLQQLRCMDALSRQIMDTCLGVAMMFFLMRSNTTDVIAESVSSWADLTANRLSDLLEWLMGAPAGLKLNSQLTQYLGHFFLYHIYLWKGYLYLLNPVLSTVLWYSLFFGILGLTVQLCVLQDIVSMMTLHIYCFYVYAARLYRLQVYTMSALWRLFRGKKWNTLRQRVDSSSFDVDQLFVGTLLFTILLFLLPTTMLYYTVFMMLRLLVLVVHGLLSSVVHFLNHFPVHTVALWIINSTSVKENIIFNAIPSDKKNGDCVFSMHLTSPSLFRVISLSRKLCSPPRESQGQSWGHFISSLVKGKLVYPWIDLNGNAKVKME